MIARIFMPPLDGLRVVHSKIHGYGVIATRRIPAGSIICYGDGVLYPEDADFDDTYALIFDAEDSGKGETVFWDLADQTRWINHACEPSSEVCGKWDPATEAMQAWWVALRDIEVGEEITYDYAFTAEVAEPCACGTPACRGVIVDADPENLAELSDELKQRLRLPQRAAS